MLSDRLALIPGYSLAVLDSAALTLTLDSGECGTDTSLEILTVLFDSLKVGYLICGRVEEFGISRFGIATPALGGYQSYRAGVEVSFCLWQNGSVAPLLEDRAQGEVRQKGLGLTFLGKPTEEMEEYQRLDELEFGSEEFMDTIIGKAVDTLISEMVDRIQTTLPPQNDLVTWQGQALVLSVEESQVYFDRGFEDGVKVGDRFGVYTQGEALYHPQTGELLGYSDRRVATIRVTFVKAAHLSRAEVIERIDDVKPGDEVRVK
jgi:hypothetical protein